MTKPQLRIGLTGTGFMGKAQDYMNDPEGPFTFRGSRPGRIMRLTGCFASRRGISWVSMT